jgi:glycosyltransferase involved in cell wall biosynthesis
VRILQAPSNIANQPWTTAQGLRAHGHEVQVWHYGISAYGFSADRVFEHDKGPDSYLRALNDALALDFNVVHFHFARSLIPAKSRLPCYWDLPVWRARGTRIVFTFHGSDIRLRSHHLANDRWSYYRYADVPCDESRIAAQMAVIRAYADRMTVGSVLDQPYAPEAIYLPRAVETDRLPMVGPVRRRCPVVLHAPSLRSTKGTEFVLAGLEDLRQRNLDFEVDLVEGVTHEELMARVADADIVVDQLLTGEMGVSSLEAMSMGKVAVARIRPEVQDQNPGLPVFNADPDTFVDVMAELVASPDLRADLGERGRAYVVERHDAAVIGEQLTKLYQEIRPRELPAISPVLTPPQVPALLEKAQDRI